MDDCWVFVSVLRRGCGRLLKWTKQGAIAFIQGQGDEGRSSGEGHGVFRSLKPHHLLVETSHRLRREIWSPRAQRPLVPLVRDTRRRKQEFKVRGSEKKGRRFPRRHSVSGAPSSEWAPMVVLKRRCCRIFRLNTTESLPCSLRLPPVGALVKLLLLSQHHYMLFATNQKKHKFNDQLRLLYIHEFISQGK